MDEDMLSVTLAIVANKMSASCNRDAISMYGLESFTGIACRMVMSGVEAFERRHHSIPSSIVGRLDDLQSAVRAATAKVSPDFFYPLFPPYFFYPLFPLLYHLLRFTYLSLQYQFNNFFFIVLQTAAPLPARPIAPVLIAPPEIVAAPARPPVIHTSPTRVTAPARPPPTATITPPKPAPIPHVPKKIRLDRHHDSKYFFFNSYHAYPSLIIYVLTPFFF